MDTIQYRVERNPLTKTPSYKLRFVPRGTAGYDDLAARLAAKHPGWPEDEIKLLLQDANEEIKDLLCNGMKVVLEDAFTYRPSLRGRLDEPDDPLPPTAKVVGVTVSASPPFIKAIQMTAILERILTPKKMPNIVSAADISLELSDVLNPMGVLHLTGSNLFFDWNAPDCHCTISGTRSGSAVQNQFAAISDSEILLVPHVPAQDAPWNNEYTVSITTRYTEQGSLRTGEYEHKLRTPLTVPGLGLPTPPETGILTGNAATPYVGVNAGTLTADERLRIQVVYDQGHDWLSFNLIDMHEDGAEGAEVTVTQNGEYILPGFSGSNVSTLEITVNDYAALKTMVDMDYNNRLVDVLDVKMGS